MNLFGLMETSGSAMQAERIRAEVVASNMANAETTRTSSGGAYHRQHVVFASDSISSDFIQSIETAARASMGGSETAFSSNGTGASPSALLSAPGVHIAGVVADPAPPLRRFDPGHPDAGPDGYVEYPDINPLAEMVDLMGATRAYGLNSSAVQAEKGMIASALEISKI